MRGATGPVPAFSCVRAVCGSRTMKATGGRGGGQRWGGGGGGGSGGGGGGVRGGGSSTAPGDGGAATPTGLESYIDKSLYPPPHSDTAASAVQPGCVYRGGEGGGGS